ncbi:MAG: acyltransferase [Acidobacteriota bacterium]|jgi:acetyltransferase-like isoleucine patch superfamily enzyme|nr:acyltransferase [Acidobacteriota bacterium]
MSTDNGPIPGEQKTLMDPEKGAVRKYRDLFLGPVSTGFFFKYEIITTLFSSIPGALGFALRKLFFRRLFASVGRGVVFGRNMTIRHPRKIHIGNGVVFDDNTVLDAKGRDNQGIHIGDHVVVGRNTIISCKGGDILIDDFANIGPNNTLLSESTLKIGKYVFTAGQTYMVAGGNHSFERRDIPIWHQPSRSKGGIEIEDDVWIGASVTVLDGVKIRTGCVIGAGSVVHRRLPAYTVALGNPLAIVKKR